MRLLILTMAQGTHKAILAESMSPIKQYAMRIGAQFRAIVDDKNDHAVTHYRKIEEIAKALEVFDRVLWLDCDVLVSKKAPSIFDVVPVDKIGAFNEAPWVGARHEQDIKSWKEITGHDLKMGVYFNTGVIVASQCHKKFFTSPTVEINHYGEQTWLNHLWQTQGAEMFELSHEWNRMDCTTFVHNSNPPEALLGEDPYCGHIIHFAGKANNPELPKFMHDMWLEWQRKNFIGEKRIIIMMSNGMGNQIACIPAIRHFMKQHPDYKFTIKTGLPETFETLRDEAEVLGPSDNANYPFAKVRSSSYAPFVIGGEFCHPTDYHSISIFQRQIPNYMKKIEVPLSSCGAEIPAKTVAIHAGKSGWPAKEMPKDLWEEIIRGLQLKGFKIALIGTREFKNKDPQELTHKWGAFEFENIEYNFLDRPFAETCDVIRQCDFLLTNDSMPVHAAGAFNNWIGLITIAKRPEFILPYRHGSQDFKAMSWTGKPVWEVKKEIMIGTPKENFNIASMWDGMQWPDPAQIVKDIVEAYHGGALGLEPSAGAKPLAPVRDLHLSP